jgi:protein-tyrosine phosphatase
MKKPKKDINTVKLSVKEVKEVWHTYIERIKRLPDGLKWFFEEELDGYVKEKLKKVESK